MDAFLPADLAVSRVDANQAPQFAVFAGRLEEKVLAPDDGTGVADARQRDLPDDVLLGAELQRDILVIACSGAVAAAESFPVVGTGNARETRNQYQRVRHSCHDELERLGVRPT
jgi:hypothetical protein